MRLIGYLLTGLLTGACSAGNEVPPCESDCPERVLELDPGELPTAPVDGDPARVRVGFFLSVERAGSLPAVDAEEASSYIAGIVDASNEILGACSIAVELESAMVIALPSSLMDIQGNEPGSYGGHPPPGTENPEQFSYDQNETLTAETRKLFEYGKAFTSPNAISAFTVSHIEYYAEGSETPTGAGGLSFPPNNYHREEDYPARNSVLLVPDYGEPGALPGALEENTLAHELGHMLLNAGGHPANPANLMSGYGTELTAEQCATMQENLDALFGDEPVVDPGRPGE